MTTPTLRLLTALVLGCLGFLSSAQSQTTANQKLATGTVSGRVTLGGKGVPGISVVLRNSQTDRRRPASALIGKTDLEGNYRVSKLPAGQYQAAPIAPTFVISEMTRSRYEGKLVVLTEGENVVGIDFTLVKAGVITGKVLDAEGRPIVEERLNVIAVDQTNQIVRPQMLYFPTDDRGVYRIFGLPAGRYKVSVGQESGPGALVSGRARRPYRQTFHPNVVDPSQATIVEVLEGGETSGVDISVSNTLDGYAARGRIIDGETGQPVANVGIGVAPRVDNRDYGYLPFRSLSSSRGEFRVQGLTPGRYTMVIAPGENNDLFADPVLFEVLDRDVDNLIIKTSKGASLTGVVVLDGSNDKALLARLYQSRLNVLIQGGPPGLPTWRSTAINPDGSFRLTGLQAGMASVHTISALDYQLSKDFVVLHAERDGVRVTQGIELKVREETGGLRVVVAHGTGVVRGEVIFVNGTPAPGSRLVAQLTRAGEITALRTAEVDARGHFAIEGMPGGTYLLQIHGYIPGARNRFPSQQVNVVDAVITEVTISLDLNPTPGAKP